MVRPATAPPPSTSGTSALLRAPRREPLLSCAPRFRPSQTRGGAHAHHRANPVGRAGGGAAAAASLSTAGRAARGGGALRQGQKEKNCHGWRRWGLDPCQGPRATRARGVRLRSASTYCDCGVRGSTPPRALAPVSIPEAIPLGGHGPVRRAWLAPRLVIQGGPPTARLVRRRPSRRRWSVDVRVDLPHRVEFEEDTVLYSKGSVLQSAVVTAPALVGNDTPEF